MSRVRRTRAKAARIAPQLETRGTTKRFSYPSQSFGSSFSGTDIVVFWAFQVYPTRYRPPTMQAAFARRLRVDPSERFPVRLDVSD